MSSTQNLLTHSGDGHASAVPVLDHGVIDHATRQAAALHAVTLQRRALGEIDDNQNVVWMYRTLAEADFALEARAGHGLFGVAYAVQMMLGVFPDGDSLVPGYAIVETVSPLRAVALAATAEAIRATLAVAGVPS